MELRELRIATLYFRFPASRFRSQATADANAASLPLELRFDEEVRLLEPELRFDEPELRFDADVLFRTGELRFDELRWLEPELRFDADGEVLFRTGELRFDELRRLEPELRFPAMIRPRRDADGEYFLFWTGRARRGAGAGILEARRAALCARLRGVAALAFVTFDCNLVAAIG